MVVAGALGGRGSIISALRLERFVEPFVYGSHLADAELPTLTTRDRIAFAREAVADIIKRVWLYVLIGVGIGAAIHGWIPQTWVETVLGSENPFSVVIATLIGVPMYADIFGTLPIAEALVGKGVGLGTVLAFMMAVTALSLPSLVMLKKVVKTPLLATFFGLVVGGILIIATRSTRRGRGPLARACGAGRMSQPRLHTLRASVRRACRLYR